MSQLHPNSLLTLAIFQFLCEAFVGGSPIGCALPPLLQREVGVWCAMIGGFTFHLCDGQG
jgi:hypothetical protein